MLTRQIIMLNKDGPINEADPYFRPARSALHQRAELYQFQRGHTDFPGCRAIIQKGTVAPGTYFSDMRST